MSQMLRDDRSESDEPIDVILARELTQKSSSKNPRKPANFLRNSVCLAASLLSLGYGAAGRAQAEQSSLQRDEPTTSQFTAAAVGQQDQQSTGQAPREGQQEIPQGQQLTPGSISGSVVDQSGAVVAGAQVTLIRPDEAPNEQIVGGDGQFSFNGVTPGPFQITVTATGLVPQSFSQVLQPGDNYVLPPITLRVATEITSVRVEPPPAEIAEIQIKQQEKQRVLAMMPNFYVSYVPNAVSLTPKQKFELAWKTVIDPFTFALNGAVAGAEQAENEFNGYGQGAAGYGKRFGAGYADIVTGTFIGSAILPSILKQDPRYFYKGTGSKRSRLVYALANAVICKGDSGHWQPNYSGVMGSLAAGGIANLYYPKSDRNRVGFVFESTGIGIGETAVLDVFQEFFIRKLTPKPRNSNSNPAPPQI